MDQSVSAANPLQLVTAGGADYEIGRAIGRATATGILRIWNSYFLRHAEERFGTRPDRFSPTAAWLRQNLDAVCPWMLEQMEGIADGCGLASDSIVLLNHYPLLWSAHGLGCSSMALRVSERGPVLAQNLDLGQEELYYVCRIQPSKGPSAILGCGMFAMVWAPTGMNGDGLVVGSSNLPKGSVAVSKPLAPGIPNTFIPRLVLRNCSSTPAAVAFLHTLPPVCPLTAGYQLNLIDREGRMAVVDITGERQLVRQCSAEMNFTTNCSMDPAFETWRTSGKSGAGTVDAHARARRMQNAFEALGGETPTAEWLKALFCGAAGEGALCRTGDGTTGAYTRLSLLYWLAARKVEISNGPPHRHPYQIFHLPDNPSQKPHNKKTQ